MLKWRGVTEQESLVRVTAQQAAGESSAAAVCMLLQHERWQQVHDRVSAVLRATK